jgi:hypothetical protein
MSVQTVTDMSAFEADVNQGPTVHTYPGDPRYRSGAAKPQPGDVALCGHVKRKPYTREFPGPTCSGCRTLKGMS